MQLNQNDLQQLCQLAEKAALSAGDIIRQYANDDLNPRLKEGNGSLASKIVTKVDILAQNKILEILSDSINQYDLALLTEESEDDEARLIKDYFWCVDPLDG
ncbi:MAG: inositol monophosphatase, partial [Gammaproteobacteria bacterium]|nr:inositol monophosphatase [Gammaproteobacteria bacterium]